MLNIHDRNVIPGSHAIYVSKKVFRQDNKSENRSFFINNYF